MFDAGVVGQHDRAGALVVALEDDAGAGGTERLTELAQEGDEQIISDERPARTWVSATSRPLRSRSDASCAAAR